MSTTAKVPPATAARIVERVRHHLYRLNQRLMPAPAAMMEMIIATWISQAITVAAELGVADALADGPLTIDELAAHVGADADALRRLLRALIGRGVFRRRHDGRYELNSLADTLRSDATRRWSWAAQFYGSREQRERWTLLADSIRTGRSVVPVLHGKESFDYFAEHPAARRSFQPDHDQYFGVDRCLRGRRLRLQRLPHDRRCRRRARPTAGHHPGRDAGHSQGVLYDLPAVVSHGVKDLCASTMWPIGCVSRRDRSSTAFRPAATPMC